MKLYQVRNKEGGRGDAPVYVIRDGKFYRTVHHPSGWSETPDYEIGTDGKVYRTAHNQMGPAEAPDYEFRKDQHLYRTRFHPAGAETAPEYLLMD